MPIQNTLIFDQLNKLAQEFELRFEPSIVNGQLLLDITESQKVDGRLDRKSTRLNSSHSQQSRMPSSA